MRSLGQLTSGRERNERSRLRREQRAARLRRWVLQRQVKKDMEERLQKIIGRAGIASRRHAELLILSGQVKVNGRVVRELGTKADAAKDRIEAAGQVVEAKEGRRRC